MDFLHDLKNYKNMQLSEKGDKNEVTIAINH